MPPLFGHWQTQALEHIYDAGLRRGGLHSTLSAHLRDRAVCAHRELHQDLARRWGLVGTVLEGGLLLCERTLHRLGVHAPQNEGLCSQRNVVSGGWPRRLGRGQSAKQGVALGTQDQAIEPRLFVTERHNPQGLLKGQRLRGLWERQCSARELRVHQHPSG